MRAEAIWGRARPHHLADRRLETALQRYVITAATCRKQNP
jgi:hypothetical protein